MAESESSNYNSFRDCFAAAFLQRITQARPSKESSKRQSAKSRQKLPAESGKTQPPIESKDAEDLAEFIEYLSTEIFFSLPSDLQTLSYSKLQSTPSLQTYQDLSSSSQETLELLLHTLPPTVPDSLSAYSILPASTSLSALLSATLTAYVAAVASPPPIWTSTRKEAEGCEICARGWIPLTYHHLIPKQVHDRVLKRGWHAEWELGKVAWLCRACHSFVHGIESNEELARRFYSVELLMQREDVRRWAAWVGGVRWKAR